MVIILGSHLHLPGQFQQQEATPRACSSSSIHLICPDETNHHLCVYPYSFTQLKECLLWPRLLLPSAMPTHPGCLHLDLPHGYKTPNQPLSPSLIHGSLSCRCHCQPSPKKKQDPNLSMTSTRRDHLFQMLPISHPSQLSHPTGSGIPKLSPRFLPNHWPIHLACSSYLLFPCCFQEAPPPASTFDASQLLSG